MRAESSVGVVRVALASRPPLFLPKLLATTGGVMRRLVFAFPLMLSHCFSGFQVQRYRAPGAAPSIERIAVVRLVVQSGATTNINATFTPFWVSERHEVVRMSEAEYRPADAAMIHGIQSALEGYTIVVPDEVDRLMSGVSLPSLQESMVEVAARARADAVLVTSVRNFNSRAAGISNAQAEGLTDVNLYDARGNLLWSLSAQVVRGPAGTNAAPTLTQFLEYAMEEMEPEIRKMMRGK